MIFGKYINRYYLRSAPVLLLGLLALLTVDYIQLMIPELYRLVINGVNLGEVVIDGQTLAFTKEVLFQHICLPMIWIVLLMVVGRFLWRVCFFGSAVLYLRRGWLRQLGRSCVAYLGGLALAALPWFAYFGAHHALDAWWECYFYDNLFLYKGDGRSALTLAQHLWWAVRDDLPAVCLLAAFLLWTVLSKRRGAALATLAMAAGLAFTSLMGGYLVYYGLVLAVFAPLGLAALPQKLPAKRGVCAALSVAGIAAAAAWCLLLSPNRALRGRTAESLPQLQFAEIIRQTPNATLLNYGTLDGGFYTAAGVLPPCRYFCVTNMPLQDQWQQQWDLLDAAAVDYVVALTGDLQNDYPIYHCVASQTYNGGEGEVTWYLYAKTK